MSDDAELVDECGHYLIQGSEFLMTLAAELCKAGSGEDFRFRLREFGIPTVLEVDIPIEVVGAGDIEEAARMILSEWGQTVTKHNLGLSQSPCYVVRRNVTPENIVGHTHPTTVPDPHRGFVSYLNDRSTCEFCIPEAHDKPRR